MSKILIDEATAKQVLAVLEGVWKGGFSFPTLDRIRQAITALRKALAEQPAQPQEPWEHHAKKLTQWLHCMSYNDSYFGEPAGLVKQVTGELSRLIGAFPQPAQQEPKKDLMYSTVAMQERHTAFVDRAVATLEQAKREALAEQPAQQEPVAWNDEQLQMLNFLYGAGNFDGVWFDQKHPTEKGAFWWRKHLRRLFDTPQAQPAPVQGWKLVPVKPTKEMITAGSDDLRLGGSIGTIVRADECYRAMLAAAPQPAQPQQEPVAVELVGVEEAIKEGDGFWKPCTGCYETNEGYPPTGAFFSAVFKCHMGHGCSECGGIGAIWDDTDYEAMEDLMMRDDAAPQPAQQEPTKAAELVDALIAKYSDKLFDSVGPHDAAKFEEDCNHIKQALAQQQEPVAYWIPKAEQFCIASPSSRPFAKAWEPLYTSPPAQRTWVGLTPEEVMESWEEIRDGDWAPDFYAVIEAKLKEKNT